MLIGRYRPSSPSQALFYATQLANAGLVTHGIARVAKRSWECGVTAPE